MQQEAGADDRAGRGPDWAAAARRYRVLAQPVRLRLLDMLNRAETKLTITEVGAALGVSTTAASRHAALLTAQGFLEQDRIGQWVACRLTPAGTRVLENVRSAAAAANDVAQDTVVTAPTLAEADAEDVAFWLSIGVSRLAYGGHDREEWCRRLVREFGSGIRPHLDILRAAVLRIARQESFDGLPLPPEVLRDGVAEYASSAWKSADPVPAE